MKIKNFHDLAQSKEREAALMIAETALQAIDTKSVMEKNFVFKNEALFVGGKYVSLQNVDRIFVVGVGKCSIDAASVVESVLGDRITDGLVLCIGEQKLTKMKTYCGTHPFPSLINVEATGEIIKMLRGMTERDLVFFLISGGGSTLLCQPKEMTCEDEKSILQILFEKGATIEEINILRKHISLARGGFLAKHAYPAKVISLIFSDVPGNNMEFIASGPTVKDSTTITDAKRILEKYHIEDTIVESSLIETPKEEKYFKNVWNLIVVSNEIALHSMEEKARELGFTPVIKTATLTGEAREVAKSVLNELEIAPPHTVLLYGGETTVTVEKEGKGGRGLEFVLSACRTIRAGELVMSVASDGRDNTEFAGALCDIITKEKARKFGLDIEQHLEDNLSFKFFDNVGDYLMTGRTGSNVSDLIICVKL